MGITLDTDGTIFRIAREGIGPESITICCGNPDRDNPKGEQSQLPTSGSGTKRRSNMLLKATTESAGGPWSPPNPIYIPMYPWFHSFKSAPSDTDFVATSDHGDHGTDIQFYMSLETTPWVKLEMRQPLSEFHGTCTLYKSITSCNETPATNAEVYRLGLNYTLYCRREN